MIKIKCTLFMLKSIIIPYILFIFTASQLHTAPRQSTQADTSGHPTLTLHKNINIHAHNIINIAQ